MITSVYKLKDKIVWVLMLQAGERTNVGLFANYEAVFTLPTLYAFPVSGPLDLVGPQHAILILPLTILPPETITQIQDKTHVGQYREILSDVPAPRNLTVLDVITGIGVALTKTAEYELKATPEIISPAPAPDGKIR